MIVRVLELGWGVNYKWEQECSFGSDGHTQYLDWDGGGYTAKCQNFLSCTPKMVNVTVYNVYLKKAKKPHFLYLYFAYLFYGNFNGFFSLS